MEHKKERLKELARLFIKLGVIGFGGPAVHIALMEQEVVKKRKWISDQHFLDLVGATNLIPGPNSTEMTMHIGQERAGWKGLILAGCCFILPAVLITGMLAWMYQEYGSLPEVDPFIRGARPAIIAVIIMVCWTLGRKAVKSMQLALLGIFTLIAALAGFHPVLVLFGAGAIAMLLHLFRNASTAQTIIPVYFLQLIVNEISGWKIFLIFLKTGALLYGSGYVLFSFLDAELVEQGLLSRKQLMDAIAVGQFTPGPVFSAASFIGWQMGGFWGALAATIGIFLPSFLFVGLLNPLIPRLRSSKLMGIFLDTVNVASIALILVVAVEMGKEVMMDFSAWFILVPALVLLALFPRLNSAFIILGGALAGYLFFLFS